MEQKSTQQHADKHGKVSMDSIPQMTKLYNTSSSFETAIFSLELITIKYMFVEKNFFLFIYSPFISHPKNKLFADI